LVGCFKVSLKVDLRLVDISFKEMVSENHPLARRSSCGQVSPGEAKVEVWLGSRWVVSGHQLGKTDDIPRVLKEVSVQCGDKPQ